MKKMKKLFFSVFALSALMLSACSGNGDTPSSSAAGESSTQQSSSAQSSSQAEASSSGEEESSSGEGSSSEAPVVQADYRVTIGTQTYDLVPNEGQVGHDKEYFLGANVSKTVAVGEKVSFEKLQNDAYSAFAVNPSPDAEDYNNVELVGSDYKIKVAGSVGVYLKLDGSDWSYWITGGGAAPDKWYESYRLAYGETNEADTWGFAKALEGSATEGGEGYVKQLKFTIEVPAGKTYGAKVRNAIDYPGEGHEAYGDNYAQPAYRDGEEGDNNITLTEGKYDIYFKLLEENGHGIWVAKYGPSTIEHLYASINGEDGPAPFERRVEPEKLWNQFFVEDVDFAKDEYIQLWTDEELTQSAASIVSLDEASAKYINIIGDKYYIRQGSTTEDNTYSFYINEEQAGKLKFYVTSDVVVETTKVLFDVPYDTTSGEDLYVLGDFNGWSAKEEYKLHYKEVSGHGHWVVDPDDNTKGFNLPVGGKFKVAVVNTNPDVDIIWEQGKNRTVVADLVVDNWQVDIYSIKIGTADPVDFENNTDSMSPDTGKYAEYYLQTTVADNATYSFYFNGDPLEIEDGYLEATGNAAGGKFTTGGEIDIYFKLYTGTGEHVGRTDYKIWASTPIQLTEYAFSANSGAALPDENTKYIVHSWNALGSTTQFVNTSTNKVNLIKDATGFLVAMTTAETIDDIVWVDAGEGINVSNKTPDAVVTGTTGTVYYQKLGSDYAAATQLFNITFSVDISGQSSVTSVNLAGNFNGWSTTTAMSNGGSGNVYTLTVYDLPYGYKPTFKFALNGTWDRCDAVNRTIEVTETTTVSYKYDKYTVSVDLADYLNDEAVVYAYQYVNESNVWYEYDSTHETFNDVVGKNIEIVRFKPGTTTPSWTPADIWNQSESIALQSDGSILTFKNWAGGTDGKSQFEWK